MNRFNTMLKALLFASAFAASALAQETALVPFKVNVNATVKAQQGARTVSMDVTANETKTLTIPLQDPLLASPGRAAPNPAVLHGFRGRLSLELSPLHYRNAEISLYSLNGKRVLHDRVSASDAAKNISRQNIATGIYVLHVKGSGNAFSSRLSHHGGGMNIDVSFGDVSPVAAFKESADFGVWDVTVSAAGYESHEYQLEPVEGENPLQNIHLHGVERFVKFNISNLAVGGDFEDGYIAVYSDAAATKFIGGGKINGDSKTWLGKLTGVPANHDVHAVVIACGTNTFYAAKQVASNLGDKAGSESLSAPKEAAINFGATTEKQILLAYSFKIDGKVPLQQLPATHANFQIFFQAPGLVDDNFEPIRFPLYASETSAETKNINVPNLPSLPFPIHYWAFGWQTPSGDFTTAFYSAEKTSLTELKITDSEWWLDNIGDIAKRITGSVNLSAFGITAGADDVLSIAFFTEDGEELGSATLSGGSFSAVIPSDSKSRTAYAQVVVKDNSNLYEPKKVVYSNNFTITAGNAQENVGALALNASHTHPTVTFKTNGGTWSGGGSADVVKLKNEFFRIPLDLFPADPHRASHGFVEWNTQADGNGTTINANEPVPSSTVLYARWEFTPVTVNFKVNGGIYRDGASGDIALQTNTSGVIAHLPAPVRDGHRLAGWNTAANGSGTPLTAETVVADNVSEVYAQWQTDPNVHVHTVTFNANGGAWGSETTKTQLLLGGETAVLHETPTTAKTFVRTDITTQMLSQTLSEGLYRGVFDALCNFDGWNTQADGNGSAFTSSTTITSNITVYAKWNTPQTMPPINPTPIDMSAYNDRPTIVDKVYSYIYSNPGDYILMVGSDVEFNGVALQNASSLMLIGAGGRRTLTRTNTGQLFYLNNVNAKLTLDYNITLQGRSDNGTSIVIVENGQLVMNEGAIITGNTTMINGGSGGGVSIGGSNSTFIMNGGTISGNTSGYIGGGVYVASGTFIKTGGTIYGSDAAEGLRNTAYQANGQAVFVNSSRWRNTTAGPEVNLNSGTSDGWGL